jgi:thioredoxin
LILASAYPMLSGMSEANVIYHVVEPDAFRNLVLEAEVPVVVDFWADWCGPCKSLGPVFERLAERHHPDVRFVKVDTERAREIAAHANVRSLPTIAFFWEGQVRDVIVGVRPEAQIDKTIQRLRNKAEGRGILSRLLKRPRPGAPS